MARSDGGRGMQVNGPGAGRWLVRLAFAAALLTPPAGSALARQSAQVSEPAAGQQGAEVAGPPVLGCSWSPDRLNASADGGDGAATEAEADEEELKIIGTIPAPPGASEDDEEALKPLAKITRAEAIRIAERAIPEPGRRRLLEAELDIENGYVVWEVELGYRRGQSGPDVVVEVIIDAGDGRVLLIACGDQED